MGYHAIGARQRVCRFRFGDWQPARESISRCRHDDARCSDLDRDLGCRQLLELLGWSHNTPELVAAEHAAALMSQQQIQSSPPEPLEEKASRARSPYAGRQMRWRMPVSIASSARSSSPEVPS